MSFKSGLLFASTLSFAKFWNGILLFVSFYISKAFKKPVVWGKPASLSIEPTTACNLRCPECPSGLRSFTRPTGNLQQKVFSNIISQTHKTLTALTFYFQGEPYINPNFLDMVKDAVKHKVFTITSTNAHFLNDENSKRTIESGLHRLIISIDGTTQDTYEQYRKEGNLEKVIEGTKNILAWRKKLKSNTPEVVFQYLVVKPNEHQVEEVKQIAKDLGVDKVNLKTAQIYDFENGNELMPTIDKYSRYKKNASGKYELKNKLLDQCWRMWRGSVVTWDGKVVPCCFDKDAQHEMGNISQTSFQEIWKSPPYQNFRKALLTSRKEIDICKNCSEGTEVFA